MSEATDLQRMGTKVRSDPRPYKLYEILTGRIGTADQRCYVWHTSEEGALQMFFARYPHCAQTRSRNKIRELLQADAAPFVTKLSDVGWERQGEQEWYWA